MECNNSILVTDAAIIDSGARLCGAIENEFGTGSCYICDEGEVTPLPEFTP